MTARVVITLKPGLLDAQGKTIQRALDALGFSHITEVRVGKYVEVDVGRGTPASVKRDVERMCKKLLANPVIERCRVEVVR